MHWKFWRRKKQPGANNRNGTLAMPAWLPLAGSQKELLALQRTVGNQAMLKLLKPESTIKEPNKAWWFRLRGSVKETD